MKKICSNKEIGNRYEALTVKYLEKLGYIILEKNFRCRLGEIDIIAEDNDYLVFIEVKYRKNSSSGFSLEAVDIKKQRTIFKVAEFFMLKNRIPENHPSRFDVIGIDKECISHIKNAFGGM